MLGFIFGAPGWGELLVLGAIGLLIFGKRLPEVGRSLGKGIVEFKKGLSGIEDDADQAAQPGATHTKHLEHHDAPPPHSPTTASDSSKQPTHTDS